MPDHPYGAISLLPPVAAIGLAIVTRRVVLSLLAGILAGTLILNRGNLFRAIADLLEEHLWQTLTDATNLRIFAFTLLMAATVGVISRSGGMQGLIGLVTPWAKDRRRGQLATWTAGLLIFFDDYANTILLGNTLRSLCDKLRISREKLAYIVDSTAAPVAGLAPLSTWVAWEVLLIDEGLTDVGAASVPDAPKAIELFLYSIPYRFYAVWMLAMVALTAILRRDFGPMRKAEAMCVAGIRTPGQLPDAPGSTADDSVPAYWWNAVVPVGVMIGVVMWLLYQIGVTAWTEAHPDATELPKLHVILGEADSTLALCYASLAGLALASVLAAAQRILSLKQIGGAALSGAALVVPALAILACAMALSTMTRGELSEDATPQFDERDTRLYSGVYLRALLLEGAVADDEPGEEQGVETKRQRWLRWSLPTVIFVLAGIVAFCTGTSFGTMGILMPMTVSLALGVLGGIEGVSASHPILLAAIAGVLAGSIFGDHCSPISDTTVLSAQSSGCNHIAHVWTQMPYALTVAAVTILCGTLPLGFGVSVWLLLPLGLAMLVVILLVFGRSTEKT